MHKQVSNTNIYNLITRFLSSPDYWLSYPRWIINSKSRQHLTSELIEAYVIFGLVLCLRSVRHDGNNVKIITSIYFCTVLTCTCHLSNVYHLWVLPDATSLLLSSLFVYVQRPSARQSVSALDRKQKKQLPVVYLGHISIWVWGVRGRWLHQKNICSLNKPNTLYSVWWMRTVSSMILPCRNRQFFIHTNNTKVMDVEESTGCLSVEFRHLVRMLNSRTRF